MKRSAIAAVVAALVVGSVCGAADWAQWMGPNRNGVIEVSPPLIASLPGGGLEPVWTSEDTIPGGGQGGYGSLAVADGRVYAYMNTKYEVPFETRVLDADGLESLGWAVGMPEALADALEIARHSDALVQTRGGARRNWARDWLRNNLPEDAADFQRASLRRLTLGPDALPAETVRKLEPIVDGTFAAQAELDQWFDEAGIEGDARAQIMRVIPTSTPMAYDEIVCLDAETGKTLWRQQLDGRHHQHSSSPTPTVADGRVYVAGSDAIAYCLDAATGDILWTAATPARPNHNQSSSFLVHDGVAVLLAGELIGLDAETGDLLWSQGAVGGYYASAALWRHGDRDYLLCNGGRETVCLDPKTGEALWSAPGGGWATPVVEGDRMVVFTNNRAIGLAAYRISPGGAEELWKLAFTDRGANPVIWDGHAYAFGGRNNGRGVCIELDTGRVAWDVELPNTEIQSPVVADGKIWIGIGTGRNASLHLVKADPQEYAAVDLGAPIGVCTTPAVVDGRLYLRTSDRVVCYDIRE